jgi:predicted nucleic acid-binding Zn ribbon protein
MRGKAPQPLRTLLKDLMRELDAGSKLGEATVISAWQDVSGPQVTDVTEKVWLEEKRLFVKLNSATWRYELHLQRRAWCKRVNEKLGKKLIDEIVFR